MEFGPTITPNAVRILKMSKNTYQLAAEIILSQHQKALFPHINEIFETLISLPKELGNELSVNFYSFESNDKNNLFYFDFPCLTFVVCSEYINEEVKKPITEAIKGHELATKENLKAAKIADRKLVKVFQKIDKFQTISEKVEINITNKKINIELSVFICGYRYTEKRTILNYKYKK